MKYFKLALFLVLILNVKTSAEEQFFNNDNKDSLQDSQQDFGFHDKETRTQDRYEPKPSYVKSKRNSYRNLKVINTEKAKMRVCIINAFKSYRVPKRMLSLVKRRRNGFKVKSKNDNRYQLKSGGRRSAPRRLSMMNFGNSNSSNNTFMDDESLTLKEILDSVPSKRNLRDNSNFGTESQRYLNMEPTKPSENKTPKKGVYNNKVCCVFNTNCNCSTKSELSKLRQWVISFKKLEHEKKSTLKPQETYMYACKLFLTVRPPFSDDDSHDHFCKNTFPSKIFNLNRGSG